LIVDKPNGGAASARNAAYPHIKGEYIFFVDSDDFLDITAARKLYAIAKHTNADITAFDYNIVYDNFKTVNMSYNLLQSISMIDSVEQKKTYIRQGFSVLLWNKLFRSKLILEHGLLFSNVFYLEDNIFMFLALTLADKIIFFHQQLYHHHINQTSIMHTINKTTLYQDFIKCFEFMWEELLRLGQREEFKNEYSLYKLGMCYVIFYKSDHIPEKERIDIFNKCILPEDKLFFENNKTSFRRSMQRVLSSIINNKPLSLFDKIYGYWRKLQPFECAFKMFFRKTFYSGKHDKNIDELLDRICELSEEIIELRESKSKTDSTEFRDVA
jgi:glycosyltransferase involved in cell wall biosynthesis